MERWLGWWFFAEAEADGTFGCVWVDGPGVLGEEDAALGGEAAGGCASGFHEGLPVAAGGVGLGAGIAGD